MLRTGAARAARPALAGLRPRALSLVALDEEFPGAPTPAGRAPAPVAVTTGDLGGVKCASLSGLGPAVRFGVVLAAGSRHETETENGVAHLLRQLAFRATGGKSELKLFRDLETLGATASAAVDREYLLYSVTCPPEVQDKALALLSEAVMNPALFDYEGKTATAAVKADLASLAASKEALLFEAAHEAAFGFSGLGNSLYASDGIPSMEMVRGFYDRAVVKENMVLVGAGAEMDVVQAAAKTHFGSVGSGAKAASAKSVFGAGDVRVKVPGAAETLFALSYAVQASEAPALKVMAELLADQLPLGMTTTVNTYSDAALLTLMGSAESPLTGKGMESMVGSMKSLSVDSAGVTAALAKLEVVDAVSRGTMAGSVLPAALKLLHGAQPTADLAAVQAVAGKVAKLTPAVAAVGKASAVPRASELV